MSNTALNIKLCTYCYGHYPLNFFTLDRYSKDGHADMCSLCSAQYYRLYRSKRWDAKSYKHDDTLLRGVITHNTKILTIAINQPTFDCLAYSPANPDSLYTVHFGQSNLHLYAMDISLNGRVIRSFQYDDSAILQPESFQKIMDLLLQVLKELRLRLELNDVDMINSKRVVYLLNV